MLEDVKFTDEVITQGRDQDYQTRNFELCLAVNLNGLSVVLDRLVAAGMPKAQAACFQASAESLLQLMRTENNRLFAKEWPPSASFQFPEWIKVALYRCGVHPSEAKGFCVIIEHPDYTLAEVEFVDGREPMKVKLPR